MADIYLSSVDGNDADSGATWALAKATLAAALTAAGAGGRVFVDNAHAETQASAMTLTSPGTAASPTQVLCVDRTGNPEPPTTIATTATITTTGTAEISFAGFCFVYGCTFSSGTTGGGRVINFTSTAPWWWRFSTCGLSIGGSGTIGGFSVSVTSSTVDDNLLELENTPITFPGTGSSIRIAGGKFVWRNTANALLGTIPTTLFIQPVTAGKRVELYGVDLSAAGSGKNLVDVATGAGSGQFVFQNCKLGSSVALTTGTHPGQGGWEVDFINCDSADTNYRYKSVRYQGDIDQETTIIRTGGASDGTTGISRKMVSSANSKLYSPLVLDGILVWNETTGSAITATVEVVTDNVTLTDKEAWLEVEYLGTSGFPLSSFADDRASNNNAFLGSGTNQTSSSETWTTTGLTTPVKQKLSVTFTPQEKGPIRLRVMLAKASTTMYVCPKVDIT